MQKKRCFEGMGFNTLAAHVGKRVETERSIVPSAPPIYQSSVFVVDSLEDLGKGEAEGPSYIYSRHLNPNHTLLEEAVAAMEKGEGAVTFSSGMGAITASILAVCRAGDRVVASRDIYGGTYSLLMKRLSRVGIRTELVSTGDTEQIRAALEKGARVLYIETITNPLLRVADIEGITRLAHEHGAVVMVDNTFATPYLVNPLTLGADVVIHSATKYLAGHSQATGGVVVGRREFIDALRPVAIDLGAALSPFDAWLILMGLRTLGVRVERQSGNAMALARFLEAHPKVRKVNYPGLESHPDHRLASSLLERGFGGMMSFEVEGELEGAAKVIDSLRLVKLVPSLAGVSTTVSHPALTSHKALPEEERAKAGIGDGLIRVSCGIEDFEDIRADFEQALESL